MIKKDNEVGKFNFLFYLFFSVSSVDLL